MQCPDMPIIEPEAATGFHVQVVDGPHFTCDAHDTLTRAGLRAGLAMPYECNAGGCGTCRYELVEGIVENLYADAPALSERDRKKGRFLACQTSPLSPLKVRLHLEERAAHAPLPARMRATLTGMHDVTHDIREFRFQLERPARFLPGQYALIEIPGVGSARAYSMANIGGENGEWHFQIRRVPDGRATSALFGQCAPGTEVLIDGPYGHAFLREDAPRDIVCIAGGSGLSPMLSIARGAAASHALAGRRLTFFMGGRSPADIGGERELRELPGYGENITFHPAISTPDPEGSWRGAVGFAHEIAATRMEERIRDHEWYFAGPAPMVAAVETMLHAAGVSREQIHFDRYF